MPRMEGLAKNQAPWHLRWFYGVMSKNVWTRFDSGNDPDARSRNRLGQHRHGSRIGEKAPGLVALHAAR
jgi:hypothetical protein